MQVSSARGTSMHKHIEDYLTGQVKLDFLASENEESLIMSEQIIQKGISNLDELWGAEVTLSYPNSYAGTADASGVYGGKQSILDFKQSNKPKKREWKSNDCLCMLIDFVLQFLSQLLNIQQGW